MNARREIRILSALALPVVATQIAAQLMGTVDMMTVGRIGTDELAAVSLGNVWKVSTLIVVSSVLFGMDPLISQAHGARDRTTLGRTLQRGLFLGLLISPIVMLLWSFTAEGLIAMGQDPVASHLAEEYLAVQLPSVPFFMAFIALRQYLTGRGILLPALLITLIANVLNVFLNWALVFGNLGLPELGAVGSGVATCIVQIFLAVGLLFWMLRWRLFRSAWVPFSRRVLLPSGLFTILRFGVPIGLQYGLEIGAFTLATILAGRLGNAELAAHATVLNIASLTFMLSFGVSIGAATRVGNLIGEGRARDAQQSAWLALGLGAGLMSLTAILFVLLRHALPAAYTNEEEIVLLCAGILPIAALFQIFDGVQAVGAGILRGMGRTLPASLINFTGYYLVAGPLALYGMQQGWGLQGIWASLGVGLFCVAVGLVIWIARHGPKSARAVQPARTT